MNKNFLIALKVGLLIFFIASGLLVYSKVEAAQPPSQDFSVLLHKPNYMLPYTYNNRVNRQPFRNNSTPEAYSDHQEFKFQLSVKVEVGSDMLGKRGRVFFAYTNQSYWQLYNGDFSRPFRETNHEPEIFIDLPAKRSWFGWRQAWLRVGGVHQSNGQSGDLSRSWNRIYLESQFEKNNWKFAIKPWFRLNDKVDDNPKIQDYLGRFEARIAHEGRYGMASAMIKNNLRFGTNRGLVELSWAYPIRSDEKLFLLLQYTNGYGESLIDYDQRIERVGIGVLLSGFL